MRTRNAFAMIFVLSVLLTGVLLWRRIQGGYRRIDPHGQQPAEAIEATPGASAVVPTPTPTAVPTEPDRPPPLPQPVPPYVEVHPDSDRLCGGGMVLVEGVFCPFVAHRCADWLDDDRTRCARYRPDLICEGRPSKLRFCIDRYEYPNLRGVRPATMVDYFGAERACQVEGKRLCEAEEWTLACEGVGTWPYPYGLVRDKNICNIDRELLEPDLRSFARPREVSVEVERLDQRVPSGALAGCVSAFGVYDLTGNVDEWVHNRRGDRGAAPYDTGLKGGYWGPIRARCRPMTTSHNGWFRFYQAGFRCCADTSDGEPARQTLPRKMRLPRRQTMTPPSQPPHLPHTQATE